MAKKAPRPAMMANYYEKLTKIFLVSGNALYHAAAWGKYHAIVTSIGGKSDGEMGRLAGQVLVSALAVPVGLQTEEVEELKGRYVRLSALLGLVRVPTRAGLLKDAVGDLIYLLGILDRHPVSSFRAAFLNSLLHPLNHFTKSLKLRLTHSPFVLPSRLFSRLSLRTPLILPIFLFSNVLSSRVSSIIFLKFTPMSKLILSWNLFNL